MAAQGSPDDGSPIHDLREEWGGPVPVPGGVTEHFWEATLDGRLLLQECDDCGVVQFYPRVVCTGCGALDPGWVEASGTGEVYSYTVCHIPGAPGFKERVPYVVAIVELAEGPRMTVLVDSEPHHVEIGLPVSVEFWRLTDDAALPVFVPA